MEELRLNAALAGLLHDVGKICQRAQSNPWNPPEAYLNSGQPVHAAWSLHVAGLVPQRYQSSVRAGGYHHKPEKSSNPDLSRLVALADLLSAGERSDMPSKYESKNPPGQLVSIFDRINRSEDKNKPVRLAEHYLPLSPLALSVIGGYIDSDKKPLGQVHVREQYKNLSAELEKAIGRDMEDGEAYLEHVLSVMQRLAWCVPSAFYHSSADVSLYDHSRMTAALAVCLAEKEAPEIKQLFETVQDSGKPLPESPVAMLVGGDISGVQEFIYTITSKGAAKTLRGRSFYLQLLTEAALRFILGKLDLPYTNVIYSGGGNFFLLVPPSAGKKLPAIRAELSRILLRHHGTALYLAVGSAEVPASGFMGGKLSEYWNLMHKSINIAKQQRYNELGKGMYEAVFAVAEKGGNPEQTCSICGDDQRPVGWLEETETDKRACSLCSSFLDMGTLLTKSRFVVLGWDDPQSGKKETALDALSSLGMSVGFEENSASVQISGKRATIWALDDPKNGKFPQLNIPFTGVLRYVANQVPQKTLDEIQDDVKGGFQKLGVIRMDVDNVGDMFKHGLGEQANLSRMAALSFQLSIFFEGWLQRICERSGRKDVIYTVYTGGDDGFLIGPWDVMPELAREIAGDFAKYTGQHPKITISAGMSFIGGKYPIYQAADDAYEALDDAKKSGKDAFYFLGKSWKWADFTKLREKHTRLELIVGKDEHEQGAPQSILMTLRQLASDAELYSEEQPRHVWGRWIWMGTYQLSRMAERAKNKRELASQIEAINTDLHTSNYMDIDQWGTAARWTQLKIREKADRNDKENRQSNDDIIE